MRLLLAWIQMLTIVAGSKGYLRLANQKIDTYIGSEKQLIYTNLDITKSDLMVYTNQSACLWTQDSNNAYWSNFNQLCATQSSVFIPQLSKTYKANSTLHEFTYDYYGMEGMGKQWGYDSFRIGNRTIDNMQFAILNQTTNIYSILGIGLPENEFTGEYHYSNFPYKLKQQGIIKKAMYSINSLEFGFSEFLFGAVNRAKFEDDLQYYPIVNNSIKFPCDSVMINTFVVTNTSIDATIDNNSIQLSFPWPIYTAIMQLLNGTESTEYPGFYQTTMDVNDTEAMFFQFNETYVSIPLEQIIDSDGVISIANANNNTIILGQTFLANSFIVVDLEDKFLAIGQGSAPNTNDDIEVIGSETNSTSAVLTGLESSAWTLGINWGLLLLILLTW